ncbi:hypothetical protein T484DRAFT_3633115 [Baffinella frigidus]|nr:hypothetical protein T484DRAFT_3633115 [Cryptophyta sp. CCMP2293]
MQHSASSSKRKHEEVDGSTPTPPVSTTQTNGDGAKKQYSCKCPYDGCDESRRHPGELKDHVDYKHKKIYRNVCDHINEKTGVKCEYKCARLCDLEQHKRTHSDARPHKCTVCPMAFKNPDGLTRHERKTHSDDRNHKCTGCTETFKDKFVLDRHWVAKHSPKDNLARTKWKCTECNEGFPTSWACTVHYLRKCAPEDDPGRRAFLDRINKTKRAHYAKNETIRVERALRNTLWRMMHKHGMGKVSLNKGLMGCSNKELIAHLNDNDRGFVYEQSGGVFHIDHIRPMASFKNLKCRVEVLKCMNFNNLQLLPGSENCSKSDTFTPADEADYAISKAGLAIAELEIGWRADGVCKCELCKA